jgi:hypothetical protein
LRSVLAPTQTAAAAVGSGSEDLALAALATSLLALSLFDRSPPDPPRPFNNCPPTSSTAAITIAARPLATAFRVLLTGATLSPSLR